MIRIGAIAILALRGAVRSKVVLALVFLILAIQIALPLTVEGDGTVAGQLNLSLRYTLGAVSFLLALVTVWTGCASISSDIQHRQIQMVTTKPVGALQIWLGKWIGLLLLNAGLLVFTGVCTYGLMRMTFRADRFEEARDAEVLEEIWRARKPVPPQFSGMETRIQQRTAQRLQQLENEGQNVSRKDLEAAIRRQEMVQRNRVEPDETLSWTFPVPSSANPKGPPLQLRYRFSTSSIGESEVKGVWMVGDGTSVEHRETVESLSGQEQFLLIPASLIKDAELLSLTWKTDASARDTLIFSGDEVRLAFYRHSFAVNLAKTLFLLFCELAFLGAVGVTAGALFSLPVAALTSAYTLLLLQADGYIARMAGAGSVMQDGPAAIDSLLQLVFMVLNVLLLPLQERPVLEWLTSGTWVPLGVMAYDAMVKIILYGGLLSGIGVYVLQKREVALPQ